MNSMGAALLRPLMVIWSRLILSPPGDLPRPIGLASSHASGVNPIRVLVFGSGAALGWGVLSHDLALPGHLARLLRIETGRGVDVDVLATTEIRAATALAALKPVRLLRYDAIVIIVGASDSLRLTPPRKWARDMGSLLGYLESEGPDRLRTFVLSVAPAPAFGRFRVLPRRISGPHSRILDERLRTVVAACPRTTLLSFPETAPDLERHRSPETYRSWARQLVAQIPQGLSCGASPQDSRFVQHDDDQRQQAIERLNVIDTRPDERYSRIVLKAQQLFGAGAAAIAFVDGDRQWFKATVGFAQTEVPRDRGFCDHTIRDEGAFVVEDTLLDERFSPSSGSVSVGHFRFYAGFPIETPDGERVGALSIYDARPRAFTEADTVLLRDLALLVQDQLWVDQDLRAVQ